MRSLVEGGKKFLSETPEAVKKVKRKESKMSGSCPIPVIDLYRDT